MKGGCLKTYFQRLQSKSNNFYKYAIIYIMLLNFRVVGKLMNWVWVRLYKNELP